MNNVNSTLIIDYDQITSSLELKKLFKKMDKITNKFLMITAILFALVFTNVQSHDIEDEHHIVEHDIHIEIDEEISSEEGKEMVLKAISEALEVGEKALSNAMATIKIQTQQNSLPD